MFGIDDGKRFRALFLCFFQSGECIRRLSALAYENDERMFVHFRSGITKFAADENGAVEIRGVFYHSRARKRGVVCRAAPHQFHGGKSIAGKRGIVFAEK